MSNKIKIICNNGVENVLEFNKGEKIDNLPKGLKVEFRGDDSILCIHENTKFLSTCIRLGNKSYVEIKSTKYSIIGLGIWATSENTKVFIGVNFSCWGCEVKLEEMCTELHIGNDCMFSYGISIRTTDGHVIYDVNSKDVVNIGENVYIDDHVWVGYAVTILKGSCIKHDSVIAARALVCSKFNKGNVIIGGVPAKILRTNINWSREPLNSYRIKNINNPKETKKSNITDIVRKLFSKQF